MSSEDISDNRKKLTKRIVVWTLVLGALGGIIAGIVVTATKKSSIMLGSNTTLTSTKQNVIEFTSNKTTYSVDLGDPNSYVATYYGTIKEQVFLQLHAQNYSLPIEIIVSKQSFGNLLQYTIADSLIVVNDSNTIISSNLKIGRASCRERV